MSGYIEKKDKNKSSHHLAPKGEEKIKSNLSFFPVLCSLVLSVFCAALTTFVIYENADDIIPIHINVWSTDSATKVEEKINSSIADNMEKLYEKSISKLNVSITLFSCALILFTIVLGFFYFTKINEAQKLLDEVQKTPEIVFKHYYRTIYEKSISDLFSDNVIQRYDAVRNLSYSPVIDIEDYDVLKTVLFKEFECSPNVYFYNNTSILLNALIKLDFDRTIALLRDKLNGIEYDSMKHNSLLQYIIVDNSDETRKFIEDKLLKDKRIGIQLVSLLMANGVINKYSDFIIQKCHTQLLQQIINDAFADIWHFKIENVFENIMKRNNIDAQTINIIIQNNKNMSIENKIELVLFFYVNDKTNLEQSLIVLIDAIKDNDNAKQFFVNFIKEKNYIDGMKLFFSKQVYLKDYFKNHDDIFSTANDKNENSADIITISGLSVNSDGKILDKTGKEYSVKSYVNTVLGGLREVIPCITIDDKIIPVSEINQMKSKDGFHA